MAKTWACPRCGNERLGIFYGDGGIMMLPHPDKTNDCVRIVCPCGWGVNDWSATGDAAWAAWDAKVQQEIAQREHNARASTAVLVKIATVQAEAELTAEYKRLLKRAKELCLRYSALKGDELHTLAQDIQHTLGE